MTRLAVLVGSPDPHSTVHSAARHAAAALARRTGLDQPHLIDLAELRAFLLSGDDPTPARDARDAVRGSDVLLVASPQWHGTYTGLLKVFLDQLPQLGLAHAVAVPLAAVEDPRNSRGIEDDLRLVLSELGAWVTEPALLLADEELAQPEEVVSAWAEIVAPQVREALAVRA